VLSIRSRFVLAAAVATIPLVVLVTYAAFVRYNSDRARAETRASTRAVIFATLLAQENLRRAPTNAQLANAVSLLPAVPQAQTFVFTTAGQVVTRVGDAGARLQSLREAENALGGTDHTFHATGVDGTSRVWGVSQVGAGPFNVAFGLPGAAVYGSSRSALERDLALAAAAALAALIGAYLLAGRVTMPLSRRSAELQVANAALEAANEAKNEFLSRMSHELRTPLAAILGFNELLSLSDIDQQPKRWAAMSLTASKHLLDLVNEVLDLARIEAGELSISPETVPLRPLLDEAIELMEPLAAARAVTIHAPTMSGGYGYVRADRQRLKQVLINLISNAIKYNRDAGEVRIDVGPGGGDRARISVTDTGMGIDEASRARLFIPFERLETSTIVEGVGLGLALSRTLTEAMGGAIGLESTPGEGSTFWVELAGAEPVAVARLSEEIHPILAVRAGQEQRSLLYIEDTDANVRLVEEILTRRPSIKLLPAMIGSLGLELAREHEPDLILLDLHLPDINGADLLEQLRRDPRTRDIPVVILTADATQRQLDRLLAAGAHAYLTKPISVVELLQVIDTFIPVDA
jgi:signal transduction histidine kinase/CheY-like chemotaxis protein